MTRRALRRREPGQMIALAAVAMIAMVGTVAMVVDGGLFYVAHRELQNTADAAALSGVWFPDACPLRDTTPPAPPLEPPPNDCEPTPFSPSDFQAHVERFVDANSVLAGLCSATRIQQADPGSLVIPRVGTLTISLECDIRYTFGRILNLDHTTIRANAAAAIGLCDPVSGDVTDVPPIPNPSTGLFECRDYPDSPDPILVTRLVL